MRLLRPLVVPRFRILEADRMMCNRLVTGGFPARFRGIVGMVPE
jgi:hypothetical protein